MMHVSRPGQVFVADARALSARRGGESSEKALRVRCVWLELPRGRCRSAGDSATGRVAAHERATAGENPAHAARCGVRARATMFQPATCRISGDRYAASLAVLGLGAEADRELDGNAKAFAADSCSLNGAGQRLRDQDSAAAQLTAHRWADVLERESLARDELGNRFRRATADIRGELGGTPWPRRRVQEIR